MLCNDFIVNAYSNTFLFNQSHPYQHRFNECCSYDGTEDPTPTIDDPTLVKPFVDDMTSVGKYTFLLTVTDKYGQTDTDTVYVYVTDGESHWFIYCMDNYLFSVYEKQFWTSLIPPTPIYNLKSNDIDKYNCGITNTP